VPKRTFSTNPRTTSIGDGNAVDGKTCSHERDAQNRTAATATAEGSRNARGNGLPPVGGADPARIFTDVDSDMMNGHLIPRAASLTPCRRVSMLSSGRKIQSHSFADLAGLIHAHIGSTGHRVPRSVLFLAAPARAAEDKPSNLMTDDGRLDPAWFGPQAPDFHRCEGDRCKLGKDETPYDYLWVKAGFDLKGHTLLLKPWEPGAFRGDAKRDPDEIKHGAKITAEAVDELVKPLNKAYKGVATVSATEGDWIVTARVVDSAGPFGFGFMKFSEHDLRSEDQRQGDRRAVAGAAHVTAPARTSSRISTELRRVPRASEGREQALRHGRDRGAADARHNPKEAGAKKK
jgi:hypothetical protein